MIKIVGAFAIFTLHATCTILILFFLTWLSALRVQLLASWWNRVEVHCGILPIVWLASTLHVNQLPRKGSPRMIYLSNDGESDKCYGKQFQGDRFGPSVLHPTSDDSLPERIGTCRLEYSSTVPVGLRYWYTILRSAGAFAKLTVSCSSTTTTHTHICIVACQLRQWLRERATMLRYAYIACFVEFLRCVWLFGEWHKLQLLRWLGRMLKSNRQEKYKNTVHDMIKLVSRSVTFIVSML
jgi:hypothetical protein